MLERPTPLLQNQQVDLVSSHCRNQKCGGPAEGTSSERGMKIRPPNVSRPGCADPHRRLASGTHPPSDRTKVAPSGSAKYAIESTEGRFLLKGRPHRALSPERLQLMRSVMAICLEADLPVPELRPQADGARHIEQDGLVWELQTWMDGKSARRGRRDALASGIALAMFHRATRNQPPSIHSSGESKVEFTSLVGRTMERFPSSKHSFNNSKQLQDWPKKKSEERGVMDHPKQILHGDWHPKNLRMHSDGRVSGILDFDAVRVDAVAHELANAVLQVSLRRPKDLAPSQWPSGLHFRAGQQLTSAWRSRIGKAPPDGTWSMLPWLMIKTIAETDSARLRYGADPRHVLRNGSKPEPRPPSGSASEADRWRRRGSRRANLHSAHRRLAKGRAPTQGRIFCHSRPHTNQRFHLG